jgi:hypothetical protein
VAALDATMKLILFALVCALPLGIAPRLTHEWGQASPETKFGTIKGELLGVIRENWEPHATIAGTQTNNGSVQIRYCRQGAWQSNYFARFKAHGRTQDMTLAVTMLGDVRCFYSLSNNVEIGEVHETINRLYLK